MMDCELSVNSGTNGDMEFKSGLPIGTPSLLNIYSDVKEEGKFNYKT